MCESLTQEFEDFWGLEPDKDFKIVSAFRIGKGGRKNKVRHCLISLRSKEERDKILAHHYKNPLEIEDVRIEIFKDIPKYLLDLRANYGNLVQLLRRNSIIFRWEFPQGLPFNYKGKKVKIRSEEDKVRFLNYHEEDLQKELGNPPSSLEKTEKATPPTDQEQLMGALYLKNFFTLLTSSHIL